MNTLDTLNDANPNALELLPVEVLAPELLAPEEVLAPTPPRRHRLLPVPRGMTLVEIMIVLTIIAGIMVAVGVAGFNALDRAKIKTSKIKVNKVSSALQDYYAVQEPNALPGQLTDLVNPPGGEKGYLKEEDLKDAWNNDIVYNKTGDRGFELRSPGPDGNDGNEDDITVEE